MGGDREQMTQGAGQGAGTGAGKGESRTVQGAPIPGVRQAETAAERLVRLLESATTVGPVVGGLGGQPIRMHESKGEIHFHDDARGLKAAFPVAHVWSAWGSIRCLGRWCEIDTVNHTLLSLFVRLQPGDMLELYLNLEPCHASYGPTFQAMEAVLGR